MRVDVLLAGTALLTAAAGRTAPTRAPGEEFDTALSGWEIKGQGTAVIRDGCLIADRVTLHKNFRLDLDEYPGYEIKVDQAASG